MYNHLDFTKVIIIDDTGMRHDIERNHNTAYDCEQCGELSEYFVIPTPERGVIACTVPLCQACLVNNMRAFDIGTGPDTFVFVAA